MLQKRVLVFEVPFCGIAYCRDRFTVQHMLICQNAFFLPGHAVSSMQAIHSEIAEIHVSGIINR